MAKLSVIIITYNEEDNIRECLESVKWVDEIVVVDSFSQDNTVEICRQYTDKVFQHEWTSFGQQKILALEKTSNDWILNLDADERASQALADRIREILRENDMNDGYYIPFKNYFLGKWLRYGGCYPDYHLRLFRKSRGKFEQKRVHGGIKGCKRIGYLRENPIIAHTNLRELAALTERCNLFISNDSGPVHVAAAMRTSTIAIFGPSDPRKYAPYGSGHLVLRKDLPCSPCGRHRCKSHECMNLITVEDVLEAVRTQLKIIRGTSEIKAQKDAKLI